MNTFIKKLHIGASLASFAFFAALLLLPAVSFAADVSLSADKNTFLSGEDFTVDFSVDTKDVKVNALEGTILFPKDIVELKEVRDGNSSINFWVEKPEAKKAGEVSFSGITAGGFSGPKRFIFSLVFHTAHAGTGAITLDSFQLLENDGLGTEVSVIRKPFDFSVSGNISTAPNDTNIEDTNHPEDFTLFVGKDPSAFDGKYFLAWSTVDKGSGIDHYEVKESIFPFIGSYVTASSPYVLRDQHLLKKIYVTAFDKNGNTKTETTGPNNRLAWLIWLSWAVIFGILICICIVVYKKVFKKNKLWPKRIKR